MPDNTLDRLTAVDFQLLGEWTLNADTLDYRLTPDTPANRARLKGAALYAFVSRDQVLYIGKTSVGLQQRFVGYRKPAGDQSTNIKCHKGIRKWLDEGKTIQIHALSGDTPLRWGGFEINLAAGLEDSLINELEPPWNGRPGARPMTDSEMVEREVLNLPQPGQKAADNPNAPEDPFAEPAHEQPAAVNNPVMPVPMPVMAAAVVPANDKAVRFRVELGKTYYFKGFINVPIDFSSELGAQDEPLIFFLSRNDPATVETKIDRKANLNGTPRLYGGQKTARWFQKHFQLGDTLHATIVSRNEIILEEPR